MLTHLYRKTGTRTEVCFNVETSRPLTKVEMRNLTWILAETYQPKDLRRTPFLNGRGNLVEIGPRPNFATPYSTNGVSICHAAGITAVKRVERSTRTVLPRGRKADEYFLKNHDQMLQCVYPKPIETFETGRKTESVFDIPLLTEGIGALRAYNKKLGLGMDEWDEEFYFNLFVNELKRNPTNVEVFKLGNLNSEHSRHWFFKGIHIIDGIRYRKSLLDIVMEPFKRNSLGSAIPHGDNSQGIEGFQVITIIPEYSYKPSPFTECRVIYNITFTAESHNHPTRKSPWPGAATCTGGRERDIWAVGRGGRMVAGTLGYNVGNLLLDNWRIPGENRRFRYNPNEPTPRRILIEASNAASNYGNEAGEGVIGASFMRSFGLTTPDGERREWNKPVMFGGGIGAIEQAHSIKASPRKGMLILQAGGLAYPVGLSGAGASSMVSGINTRELDLSSVQRGDAECGQKTYRFIRACMEWRKRNGRRRNKIKVIHDQGGAGAASALTEAVAPLGGRVEVWNFTLGDQSMSVLAIYCAEYQERVVILIEPEDLRDLQRIAKRERVNLEVLGKVTGDGRMVLHDAKTNTNPVDLPLRPILTHAPRKVFISESRVRKLRPFTIPRDSFRNHFRRVCKRTEVGSKKFLTDKVDRSVTGLIAQQQCCGVMQLPVADFGVVAMSHFALSGAALSLGEQPIKMMVNTEAGSRMAGAEMLTNMAGAVIRGLPRLECRENWMWAGKLKYEAPELRKAALAMAKFLIRAGIRVGGGKDSLSMADMLDGEVIKAPGQLILSGFAPMEDIRLKATPDIKRPGESCLGFIDLGGGKRRLGGSSIFQSFAELGNECPDVDDSRLLIRAFEWIQWMVGSGQFLSVHDVSDGGLITTIAEMLMAANCGAQITTSSRRHAASPYFLAEELGWVVEYPRSEAASLEERIRKGGIPFTRIGVTTDEPAVLIKHAGEVVLDEWTPTLRGWWEATSSHIDEYQTARECVLSERRTFQSRKRPVYKLTFTPEPTPIHYRFGKNQPKVAVIREEGSNGDREMTSAFKLAGFEVWDVTMTDLLEGRVSLKQFRGIAFVGGFSYADVFDSAKGWAATIRFNRKLRRMFKAFFKRDDTFSLGICNGCQLMALLGVVPWEGLSGRRQPRFVHNTSGKFESRWSRVKVEPSSSIFFTGMEGSILGVPVAHGEGRFYAPDKDVLRKIREKDLIPLTYVDPEGNTTEQYPYCPSGSTDGIAALSSLNRRHLAVMPHEERSFQLWQWHYTPRGWELLKASPWLKMFLNVREWCEQN